MTAKLLRDWECSLSGDEVLPNVDDIPLRSLPSKSLDPAILGALSTDSGTTTIEAYGQASSTIPSKVIITKCGNINTYFLKTGSDAAMFRGEFKSLNAIHAAVPSLCPSPIAHGKLSNSPGSFLLTEFIDIEKTSDA
ncbi:MAG: hypothetical protein Q9209_007545 [Squamulea sp. 1 TL-2023]